MTGGGSLAISDLLCIPGASQTLLEARVPYSHAALCQWLGGRVPDQACSAETAAAMAMAAFQRARELVTPARAAGQVLGLAATATLRTDRPHQGEHRIYVAAQLAGSTRIASLRLAKNARSREAEESLAAALILHMMAHAWSVTPPHGLPLLSGEMLESVSVSAPLPWRQVATGETIAAAQGVPEPLNSGVRRVLFPGAFNPRHNGHRQMAAVASARFGQPVEYEITVHNVDKPSLDYVSLDQRLRPFDPVTPVWITGTPTFVEKARLFSPVTFVVGSDTAARIGDARYYGNVPQRRDAAIQELAALEARFLVFGRTVDGAFAGLEQVKIPAQLRELCEEVPESEFRVDVSSTQLRSASTQ